LPVSSAEDFASVSQSVEANQACILCEFVMTKLDHLLSENKTEEEIKHAVHSVCRLMPKSVKQECDDFVNQYSDLIIQLLSQSLNPKQVCEALNVCKPNDVKG
jgi:Saposin-like type B, region 2./Saposin-like type B, region 1.